MILGRIRTLFFSLRGPAIALHQRARELSQWVGEWVVIFWVLRFSSKSSIVTSKMCWFQIWPQKLSTGTRSKAINNLILQIWKFKAGLRGAKHKKIMIVWKDLSLGRKLGIFFKKTNYQKLRFHFLTIKYNNNQDMLIPYLVLKVICGYYIKSYKQFNFEILKI